MQAGTRCRSGVVGLRARTVPGPATVTNPVYSGSRLESRATEGNRPVREMDRTVDRSS
jgi:hypothetical protein